MSYWSAVNSRGTPLVPISHELFVISHHKDLMGLIFEQQQLNY
uniref:Uncharacterized protein n=1 Tax=Gloeothece verrucosa (strain PCC 7822) TaxID=497965 RepID=E0U5Z5_GLOV7|nr:hypothetical protein Cyan7822_5223 [Gloeothece verrucosa PCC 7822]